MAYDAPFYRRTYFRASGCGISINSWCARLVEFAELADRMRVHKPAQAQHFTESDQIPGDKEVARKRDKVEANKKKIVGGKA